MQQRWAKVDLWHQTAHRKACGADKGQLVAGRKVEACTAKPSKHCDFSPLVHSLQSKVYGKLLSAPKYPLKDADGHTLKKGQRVQIKVKAAASSHKRLQAIVDSATQLDAAGMPH